MREPRGYEEWKAQQAAEAAAQKRAAERRALQAPQLELSRAAAVVEGEIVEEGSGPGPQLVTVTMVERKIEDMLRIWGVRVVTAGMLEEYLEVLKGQPEAAILTALREWIKHPAEDRPARPHELKAMVERGQSVAPVAPPVGHRATAAELDEVFAQAAANNPAMFRLLWEARQARRQLGHAGQGEAEASAIVKGLAGRQGMEEGGRGE